MEKRVTSFSDFEGFFDGRFEFIVIIQGSCPPPHDVGENE
jgi:hypothetical protein